MNTPPRSEKLVFDATMQSMLRTLGASPTSAQLDALARLGVDARRPLLPAYPIETFIAVITYVCEQRWPTLPAEDASFELGRAFMAGYTETLVGRALAGLMGVLGPQRVLQRMSRNFRSANNYTETRLEQQGPTRFSLWFNHCIHTGFYRGLILTGLEHARAREPSVVVRSRDGESATFDITWAG